MNVLIFVMTMLMLLSMMTYARLETYRSTQVYQLFFNKYIEEDERGYINVAMEKRYIDTKGSEKAKSEEKSPQASEEASQPPANATPRISLILLADKKKRNNAEKEWKRTLYLLKTLMDTLYKDHPFYIKATEKNPQIVDQVIGELVKAVDALPDEKKITRASELSNLSLESSETNELFYKMLHGAPYKEIIKSGKEEKLSGEADQDDPSLDHEGQEFKSPMGYYSLLDFVNLSPKESIRVYLAPREVLMAAFNQNSGIVDDIMVRRKSLYKEALDGGDVGDLKKLFATQFAERRDPELDEKALDFSISKTNPTLYDKKK